MEPSGTLPRVIAARVVFEVLERGAFIARELDRQLLLHPEIGPRDVALATELSYGPIRYQGALRARIVSLAPHGVRDPKILSHLLVAAHQLCVLDRVPPFAAVNVAVEQARKLGGNRVAGFVNAVLRRIAQQPKLERVPALREGVPSWLARGVAHAVGEQQAALLFGFDEAMSLPKAGARFRSEALPTWAAAGQASRWIPGMRLFRHEGDLRRHPEWAAGQFVVQEEGAALCGLALSARRGEKVLDACAGRGQKATLIADGIGPTGELWVSDASPTKLTQLLTEFERLVLKRPNVYLPQDDPALVPRDFDRIIVDAPCSGSGTLRHRPEILLRLSESDPARLAALSSRILHDAAERLRPGGTLLFVVCSVLVEECERVVERIRGLVPAPFEQSALSELAPPGATTFRLLPGLHGTDGYYLAHFRRPSR